MSFLVKVGLLHMHGGVCSVAEPTQRWLEAGDGAAIIAQIHSRTQFIGEMLGELHTAQDAGASLRTADLLRVANDRYRYGWLSANQISFRRGWLQSAGLIAVTDDKRLEVTAAGRSLLSQLALYEPPLASISPESRSRTDLEQPTPVGLDSGALTPEGKPDASPATTPGTVDATAGQALARELRLAVVDSSDHTRFESAVRDAFEFLGFRAEQLGGSGKTDVLLDAPRGKNHSYRVTVDAKTVGSSGASKGQLKDPQVDWPTLQEHRTKHGADYSLLVGPDPTGDRIFSRAQEFGVAVISADELAQLCLQHEELPLGLADYKGLFVTGGAVDMSSTDEIFEAEIRRRGLAEATCRTLITECANVGPMSVRDLWLTLRYQDPEQSWAADEVDDVLRTLASKLVGVIEIASRSNGGPTTYIPATSLEVAQLRLHKLAEALGAQDPQAGSTPGDR